MFGRGNTPLDLRLKLAALPTREIPGEMGGGTITACYSGEGAGDWLPSLPFDFQDAMPGCLMTVFPQL